MKVYQRETGKAPVRPIYEIVLIGYSVTHNTHVYR